MLLYVTKSHKTGTRAYFVKTTSKVPVYEVAQDWDESPFREKQLQKCSSRSGTGLIPELDL